MPLPAPARAMTTDEFLDWEAAQEERHEFVDGEIFAMVGGSLVHARLCGNIFLRLSLGLQGRGCLTFIENAKLRAGRNVFYPDIVVSCGKDRLQQRCVERPSLIVEVLSPSTAGYDRGKKWDRYREHLPTLQAYVLVAQDEVRVEVFRRAAVGWEATTLMSLDAAIELAEPACRLALAEVYEGTLDALGQGQE